MLEFKDFTISYEKPVLKALNLQFQPGQITVVSGASGSGKSSLLRTINGVIPYFQPAELSGSLTYQGQDLLALDMAERSRFISTVFQNPKTQFYATNSTDEMAFALENRNLPRQEIIERIDSYTRLLGVERLLDRDIFTLSGGEKQLLAITSVACMNNDIYMFDEPSSSLDREAIERLKEVLLTLKKLGKTLIVAEHRLYYLQDIMDQFILLEDATAASYQPQELDEDFLRQHKLRSLTKIQKSDLQTLDYRAKSMTDKGFEASASLLAQDYSYSYERQPVFDMNLSLEPGINFLIGQNGVGKSTFLRCLSGLNKRFKGRTFYRGRLLKPSYPWLSMIMQDVNYQLFTESVWSEISIVSEDEAAKEAALAQVGLLDKKERHPQTLSGGEKQRLLLAMAKVSDKPIVILDEPTSGLCKGQMERMIEDLQQMAEQGRLLIIVTHDYELIKACGGHIVEFVR
ncbi:Duplicated ATPase component of energizing module of putative ECF transporter [Streptococcus sp. DD11]|uniref:ABC transporter ATP-binding protein n=1 Tax=Streptococcus sp. DD11 TaxID=1777879 RepID=UPI0007974F4C|nr:ABC transporter ATP-binding protein [Streptococcus sp. DD11]KXT85848.1 Duplicated ATPase component of energizing module of putative ECF transporter [Streptococcus sp. DD11]